MAPRGTLLFDLDGTLVDSAVDIAAALSRLRVARGGAAIVPDTVRPLVSGGVEHLVRRVLHTPGGDLADDVAAFRAMLAVLPPRPDSVYPGALSALTELAEGGWPMAVVTNKPERLARLLLDQLDLSRFFAAVVGGDTLPVRKPDRAPLDRALALVGNGHDGALMIGDSAVDAAAARAAGLRFVLFEGGYGAQDCADCDVSRRFDRFDRLPQLLHAAIREGDRRVAGT